MNPLGQPQSPQNGQLVRVNLFGRVTVGLYLHLPVGIRSVVVYYNPALVRDSADLPYTGVMPYWAEDIAGVLDVIVPARLLGDTPAAGLAWDVPAQAAIETPAFTVRWLGTAGSQERGLPLREQGLWRLHRRS